MLHRFGALVILFSSILVPKLWAFWGLTVILYSWLLFNGCFVNTIEANIGEAEHHQTKGSIARMLGIQDEATKHKISLIINFVWYVNYLVMAYRVDKFTMGLLLLIFYFVLNGQFESPSSESPAAVSTSLSRGRNQ